MVKPDVLVTLKALLPTPQGVGVFLSDGLKTIAIFVDPYVAAAITMFAQKVRKPRPLTHDFIVAMLSGFGARATKVVINDLKGDTFFARVYLLQESELGRGVVEIDARPSDSIALAIQQKCPIYVAAGVWDHAEDATWALQQAREQQGGTAAGEGKGDGQ
ncbi:MAG: bifunctional nuclease family protein [Lentisphaerae bacterium]|nr:bifunctional nuclease family protein [Lentisphaerota bacterium]